MKMQTLCAALGLAFGTAAMSQTVYTNNFDVPAVVLPGVVATFSGGSNVATDPVYFPTFGNIVRADGVTFATGLTLSLSNLPTHAAVSVGFLMAFLNSWDSRNGSPSPDNLEVWIDGARVGQYTYNNATGSVIDIGGGTALYSYVQFDTSYFYSDSVVDMAADPAYTFAHSASTLTVNWLASGSGWQFAEDEAYGIDNLKVSILAVPEPATWALMALGVGALLRRSARQR